MFYAQISVRTSQNQLDQYIEELEASDHDRASGGGSCILSLRMCASLRTV